MRCVLTSPILLFRHQSSNSSTLSGSLTYGTNCAMLMMFLFTYASCFWRKQRRELREGEIYDMSYPEVSELVAISITRWRCDKLRMGEGIYVRLRAQLRWRDWWSGTLLHQFLLRAYYDMLNLCFYVYANKRSKFRYFWAEPCGYH